VTAYGFRYALAMRLLIDEYGMRAIQELLRDSDLRTTMIYRHVLERGGRGMQRPTDRLEVGRQSFEVWRWGGIGRWCRYVVVLKIYLATERGIGIL
jgi:hypothetical protein